MKTLALAPRALAFNQGGRERIRLWRHVMRTFSGYYTSSPLTLPRRVGWLE